MLYTKPICKENSIRTESTLLSVSYLGGGTEIIGEVSPDGDFERYYEQETIELY